MNKNYKVNALETKNITVELKPEEVKQLTVKYLLDNPDSLESILKEVFVRQRYPLYAIDFQNLKVYKDFSNIFFGARRFEEIELNEADRKTIVNFLESLKQLKEAI